MQTHTPEVHDALDSDAAAAAHKSARKREPHVYARLVDTSWEWFQFHLGRVSTYEKQADLVQMATATMRAYAMLPDADMRVLAQVEAGWTDGAVVKHIQVQKLAVIERNPALLAFRDFQAKFDAKHSEQVHATNAALNAQAKEKYPAMLLARLRQAGITLAVNKDKLTVPAGSVVPPREAAEIVEYKAGLIALLVAEEVAALPLVVA